MLSVINARYTLYVYKWFQNLRSGFPLERGIAHLDFNKLMCASRQGAGRSRKRSIHCAYVSIYRRSATQPLGLRWGFETTSNRRHTKSLPWLNQKPYSIKDLKQQSWKRRPPKPHTAKNDVASETMTAFVVKWRFLFAGRAAAGSVFAKIACLKTYGECPAMRSPGRVRIAAGKMASVINENIFFPKEKKICRIK